MNKSIEIPEYIKKNKKYITRYNQIDSIISKKYYDPKFIKYDVLSGEFFRDKPEKISKDDLVELYKDNYKYEAVVGILIWGGININQKTSFFEKFLQHSRDKLIEDIEEVTGKLKNGKFKEAFNFFNNGPAKISGVGPAYFTKIFQLIGMAEEGIEVKPLIFDKWTQVAYLALLFQLKEIQKIENFYKKINVNISRAPGAVEIKNGKKYEECYESFVNDFHNWSKAIGSCSLKLEEYVFGADLRMKDNWWVKQSLKNPRIGLWNIILENLSAVITK